MKTKLAFFLAAAVAIVPLATAQPSPSDPLMSPAGGSSEDVISLEDATQGSASASASAYCQPTTGPGGYDAHAEAEASASDALGRATADAEATAGEVHDSDSGSGAAARATAETDDLTSKGDVAEAHADAQGGLEEASADAKEVCGA